MYRPSRKVEAIRDEMSFRGGRTMASRKSQWTPDRFSRDTAAFYFRFEGARSTFKYLFFSLSNGVVEIAANTSKATGSE